jgi:hypothetical protein
VIVGISLPCCLAWGLVGVVGLLWEFYLVVWGEWGRFA